MPDPIRTHKISINGTALELRTDGKAVRALQQRYGNRSIKDIMSSPDYMEICEIIACSAARTPGLKGQMSADFIDTLIEADPECFVDVAKIAVQSIADFYGRLQKKSGDEPGEDKGAHEAPPTA